MTPDRFVHYMVNVPAIDADHLNLLTQMDVIIKQARSMLITDIAALLETLKCDLASHFLREESYMDAINFPYAGAHKLSHIAMNVVIDQSVAGMIKDGRVSEYYIKNLEELLIVHIDTQDLQYAQWVVQNRAKSDTKY